MRTIFFVTHPEVVIDPAVPVPEWPLSGLGIERTRRMLLQPWVEGVGTIYTSAERKALDTAFIAADHLGLRPVVHEALHENDRSATGYLPKQEFEAVADAFFASPAASVRGWESANDAQRRIVAAVDAAIQVALEDGDIMIVAHGGVGALLLCHLKGVSISRAEDQPGQGGGNLFAFDAATRRLRHGWRPIDAQALPDR